MKLAPVQVCFYYWQSLELYRRQTPFYVKILVLIIVDMGLFRLLMIKPRPTLNYVTVYHCSSSIGFLLWIWESLCKVWRHSCMCRFHCLDMLSWKVTFITDIFGKGNRRDSIQRWGLLSQFTPIRYFTNYSASQKYMLAIVHHIHIWHVLPQRWHLSNMNAMQII